MNKIFMISSLLLLVAVASAEDAPAPSAVIPSEKAEAPVQNIEDLCMKSLKDFPGPFDEKVLKAVCGKVHLDAACVSVEGKPIFHYDKPGTEKTGKKILVFSLIHGDERPAGSVSRYWLERLETIEPRNSWRVIPVLNPDGVKYKTRTNANKIDLNRNFPTSDWNQEAIKYWKASTSSNPRRFPGEQPGSEPETKCALKHIDDFKPDFIVSIHTPLKVLDFDGPRVKPPPFEYLPWRSLGHFPGSLGRYMWFERKTPVLTAELKDDLPKTYQPFEKLQDVIGTLVKLEIPSVESFKKPVQLKGKINEAADLKGRN
jgi:protein MpaA